MPGSSLMVGLAAIASWLFGIWVFAPLFALETASAGGGTWQAQLRKFPRSFLMFWAFFAFWRLCLFIVPAPALLQFIPEPVNTTLFLWVGAGSFLLWLGVALQGRRQAWHGFEAGSSRGAVVFPQRGALGSASQYRATPRAR